MLDPRNLEEHLARAVTVSHLEVPLQDPSAKPSRRWTPILCTDHLVITCLLCAPSLGSCIFLCYAIIFDMTTRAIDLSPTADTKAHVVAIWEDKPHFACAQCSAVVVSNLSFVSPCVCFTSSIMGETNDLPHLALQALQDELISKSFSGREGRGLQVSLLYFLSGKKT